MSINSVSAEGAAAADLKRARRKGAARKPEDRLPPHDIDMERGVLGCVLIAPDECLPECITRLRSRADAFYDLRHQTIFQAFMEMQRAGDVIEVITLQSHLRDGGLLEQVGGFPYLSELPNKVPSAANLPYYLDRVCEKYELRKIITACTDVVSRVYDFTGPHEELIGDARHRLAGVAQLDTQGKCQRFKVSDLDAFDLDNDEDNLVGSRYLTRGSSLMINGPSGRGKSSLLMLRLILWALGRDFYGSRPVRPLSSIIWQTENNEGDLAKAFQGARNFLKLREDFENSDKYFEMLEENIDFVYCPALCGREFLDFAESELMKRPRDLAVLDPLVSFPEGDLNSQQGAAEFLRKGLSRISFLTKTTWIINHHTPKPLRDPRSSKVAKKVSEYQYGGAGSFDIPGWARAVETLEESEDGLFRLVLAKRGAEAGACHADGTPTVMLWLRHATDGGIHWEQVDPPSEPEPKEEAPKKVGPKSKVEALATSNIHDVLSRCETAGETAHAIGLRFHKYSRKVGKTLGETKCRTDLLDALVENRKLSCSDGLYFKGPNA